MFCEGLGCTCRSQGPYLQAVAAVGVLVEVGSGFLYVAEGAKLGLGRTHALTFLIQRDLAVLAPTLWVEKLFNKLLSFPDNAVR